MLPMEFSRPSLAFSSEDGGEIGGATASVAGAQPGDLSEGGSEMPMGSEKGLVEMASLDGL